MGNHNAIDGLKNVKALFIMQRMAAYKAEIDLLCSLPIERFKGTFKLNGPAWSIDKPTVPGWYWLDEDGEKSIVWVRKEMELVMYDSGSEVDRFLPDNCEWHGPIEPPKG